MNDAYDYFLEFLIQDNDGSAPYICAPDIEIVLNEPKWIPATGDIVSMNRGGKTQKFKGITRHFNYSNIPKVIVEVILRLVDKN